MSIMKIIKIVLITLVVAIIGILVIFIVNLKNVNNSATNNDYIKTNMLNMQDDYSKVLREVVKKNGDWHNLPLSSGFKDRYNSKDGIFQNDNYTKLYLMKTGTDGKRQTVAFSVFHDAKEEEYYVHYTVNDKNELDDVEIVDKILRYDENGKEVIYKETMNGAFVSNITQLAAPYRLEWDPFDYVYVTDHYLHKWGGGFIPYFEIDIEDENNAYISIEPYDIICNKEKQEVYFSAEYTYIENDGAPDAKLACDYIKYFKVHYITDEKAWLDDVEVEEVSKEEIDRLLNEAKSKVKQN